MNVSGSNGSRNSSVHWGDRMDQVLTWRTLETGLQTLLFFTSAVTNCFVLLLICKHKQTLKGSNVLVLNLIIAGTLMTFTVMPTIMVSTYVNGWLGTEIMCSVYSALVTMLTCCSSITVVCITLDRYYALCYPLSYKSKATARKVHLATCLTWAFSVALALIPILTRSQIRNISGMGFCFPRIHSISTFDQSYISVMVVGFYIVPVCILTYTNLLIFIKTRAATANKRLYSTSKKKFLTDSKKTLIEMDVLTPSTRKKQFSRGQRPRTNQPRLKHMKGTHIGVHRDNRKAAGVLFISIFSFTFCNGPFNILLAVHITPGVATPTWIQSIAVAVLFLNPIINPIIYVFRNIYVKNLILASVQNMLTSEECKKLNSKPRHQHEGVRKYKVKGHNRGLQGSSSDPLTKAKRQETVIVFHTETKGVATIL